VSGSSRTRSGREALEERAPRAAAGRKRVERRATSLGNRESLGREDERPGAPQSRRQRGVDHLAERAVVVVGGEPCEFQPVVRQRRHVANDGGRLAQLARRHVGRVAHVHDHAHDGARAEGDDHAAADIGAPCVRARVVEEPRQRDVERDAQNGHRVAVEEEGVTARSTLKKNRENQR